MKRFAAVVVISFFSTSIFAATLSQRYKDWAHSPQAYFMTKEDRAEWSKLKDDAEAEKFINDFVAKRGGDAFVSEVERNVAQANKYLTLGKTPGSETVRGKMMIVLGPAAPTAATKKKRSGDVRMAPTADGMSGGERGPGIESMQAASNGPGNSTVYVTEYTYTYPAAALPAAYGKQLTVKVEVDPDQGRDRFSSLGADRELDKVYEMAAQAKLAAAKPATPQP
jgi:GWxTD domain-containing protein